MREEPTLASDFSQLLIDSSAFDRLGFGLLEKLAPRTVLLVSPLSLYEIFCHLEEPRRRGEALEKKGIVRESRLCKCRLLKLLDDPFAEQGEFAPVGQWIEEISSGTAGPEVAEEARRALEEARREHARRSLDFAKELVARLGREHALSLSGLEFVRLAADGVDGAAEQFAERFGGEPALEGELFSAAYPFAGYRLARSQAQLEHMKSKGDAAFDPLDMEDAHLCLHLNLLEPRALVTANAGAREALNRALLQLGKASQLVGAKVVARTVAIAPEQVH
jgi:hypothetical protein